MRITGAESFEELVSRSQNAPVVVFKHSTTCPISAAAYDEMSRFEGEVVLVEVQRERGLAKEIEKGTGVAHESPQVIVLKKGKSVWDGSHWNVKADVVRQAVKESENGDGPQE